MTAHVLQQDNLLCWWMLVDPVSSGPKFVVMRPSPGDTHMLSLCNVKASAMYNDQVQMIHGQ